MAELTTINDRPLAPTLSPNDWLIKELKNLGSEARELFERYSKLPPDEVVPHITQFVSISFRFGDVANGQIPTRGEVM